MSIWTMTRMKKSSLAEKGISASHGTAIHAIVRMGFSDELFEVLLSDYRGYEELRLTKGRREVSEDDEKQAEVLCRNLLERWEEESE